MTVQQRQRLKLLRGHYNADVVADENVEGISHSIICECKFWNKNIPAEKVRAFRVAVDETGANRGYIISRKGFQSGAILAAHATNVELVTYERFQELYFEKWFRTRIWAIEHAVGNFNVYYESGPPGRCGYHLLNSDDERAAYDEVWNRYFFAGMMLTDYSPYIRLAGIYPIPPLPPDVTKIAQIEQTGFVVPEDVKTAIGYRELLALLEQYAHEGLSELRAVNPLRNRTVGDGQTEELDQPGRTARKPRTSPR